VSGRARRPWRCSLWPTLPGQVGRSLCRHSSILRASFDRRLHGQLADETTCTLRCRRKLSWISTSCASNSCSWRSWKGITGGRQQIWRQVCESSSLPDDFTFGELACRRVDLLPSIARKLLAIFIRRNPGNWMEFSTGWRTHCFGRVRIAYVTLA